MARPAGRAWLQVLVPALAAVLVTLTVETSALSYNQDFAAQMVYMSAAACGSFPCAYDHSVLLVELPTRCLLCCSAGPCDPAVPVSMTRLPRVEPRQLDLPSVCYGQRASDQDRHRQHLEPVGIRRVRPRHGCHRARVSRVRRAQHGRGQRGGGNETAFGTSC